MVKFRERISKRILAILLATTLVGGILPISLFSVFAAGKGSATFTVVVDDGTNLIDGAMVTFTNTEDSEDTETGTTDSSGGITFATLTDGADYDYSVSMSGYITATGSFTIVDAETETITLTLDQSASITTQPMGGTFTVGQALNLSVVAINAKAYQWHKDGTAIIGAESDTYSIVSMETTDAGDYKCVVTGEDDIDVDSNEVAVIVNKNDLSINLSIDPADGQTRPNSVTLSATGIPADATGTLTFFNGTTEIGTAVAVGETKTFTAIGTTNQYSLKVVYSGDNKYNSCESTVETYDFTIGEQAALSITGLTTTYTYGDGDITLGATGGTTSETVTYQSNNPSVATVSGNVITIKGDGKFKITATMPGNNDYNDVSAESAEVTVNQKEITISDITASSKKYDGNLTAILSYPVITEGMGLILGDNLTISATGTFEDKNVENGKTVNITDIKLAGTDAGKYKLASSGQQTTTTANITAETITVTVDANQSKLYGQAEPTKYDYTATGEIGSEKAAFNGALSRNAGETIRLYTINQNTLALKDDGVTGFLAENYTINFVNTNQFEIKQGDIAAVATFSTEDNDDGWYKEDITLIAPEGYEISLSNSIDGTWESSVGDVDTTDGENKTITYYLKDDEDNSISVAKTLIYNLDKTSPSNLQIKYSTNGFRAFINTISFGIFFKDTVDVEIKATDVISGIKTIQWAADGTTGKDKTAVNNQGETVNAVQKGATNEYSISFNVSKEFYGQITATAIDYAGNETTNTDDKVTVDSITPTISVSYNTADRTEGGRDYYKGDVTATITVTEANFFKDEFVMTVKNDTVAYTPTVVTDWANNDGVWTKVVKLTDEGDYDIIIDYTDESGNVMSQYTKNNITIDKTAPTIAVSYDNNTAQNISFFKANRTATVTITEHNFKADEVVVNITAKDVLGNDILAAVPTISAFSSSGDVHIATISYTSDANYTFDISYTDLAANVNTAVTYGSSVATITFIVDKMNPVSAQNNIEFTKKNDGIVAKFINFISFGFFANETIEVIITITDATAGVESITYYTTENKTVMGTEVKVDNIGVNKSQQVVKFDIAPDFKGYVYVKAMDLSKNETNYLESRGLIIEGETLHDSNYEMSITPQTQPNANGFYKSDVLVELYIKDDYSGINTVTYTIGSADPVTETFEKTSNNELLPEWRKTVTVNAERNNNNNVEIKAEYKDNAGNPRMLMQTFKVEYKIDVTKPVITIEYDNNTAENTNYFKANRTATIAIEELNFKNDEVIITSTKDGANQNITPSFSSNGTMHTMTIPYTTDGDYTLEVAYTDLAGNKAAYNRKDEFTIDKTTPIIEVTYDNNDAQNTNYYKAIRTATIKVSEHNWQATDFKVNVKVENNTTGTYAVFDAPNLSGWTTEGDVHTATITFTDDGRYTFSVAYSDLAGNKATDFAEQIFFVDRTMPVLPKNIKEISITNYVNGAGSTVAPKITVTDNNYDPNSVTIILKGAKNGTVALNGAWVYSTDNRGGTYTFPNFTNEKAKDDIYTISVKIKDKAGNEIESGLVEFSVNRFGSTFDLKGLDTVNGGYFKNVQDVVVREINPNKVTSDTNSLSVSRNGNIKELVSGTDYTISPIENKGKWSEYTYTVKAVNYKEDGKYITTLKNKDEANNANSSDDEAQSGNLVSFAIDNTKPTAAVSGIEKDKMYSADSVKVTVAVSDNIKLKSVEFKLNDKVITGTSLENTDTSNKFELTIPSDFNRQILVVSYIDEAGNPNTTTIENFLVNSNAFVQYYQNKTLFFGSIGGLLVIILGLAAFFIFRRKKIV